jgi:hypothetical protein
VCPFHKPVCQYDYILLRTFIETIEKKNFQAEAQNVTG